MSIDYQSLAVAGVQSLTPYQPGKPIEELAREYGLDPDDIVKLASNENPLGPSPVAMQAAQKALEDMCRYPDGNAFSLKAALSRYLKVDASQLTLGNGSNDVLEVIARCFAGPGDEVIFSQYAFAVYPLVSLAIGARGVEVPARNWGHDLPAMANAIADKTRLVFLANPNNPTGTVEGTGAMRAFLDQVPERVLVVLDEAYREYMTDSDDNVDGVSLLEDYPNLIVARTFSKAWGLAALRVGYAVSSPAIADLLNRVRQPFNVDTVAQAAAAAVLEDQDYLERSRAVNLQGMEQLTAGFAELELDWIPSAGNFVAVEVGDNASAVFEGLLEQGVIVRPVAGYGMPRHLRVSIGLPEENERFLDALARVIGRRGA